MRNQIFTTAFYSLALLLCGYLISYYFVKNLIFWLPVLGVSVGLMIGIFKYKLKILEVLEAGVLGLISLSSFVLLAELIVSKDTFYLFGVIVMGLLVLLFFLLDKYYKSFAWYKSGRIGFSGLTVTAIFFMIYSIVAITLSSMISFVESKDALVAIALSLVAFLVVFKLAKQRS